MNYVPIRHVTAIGLRYALSLSTSKLHFEIPLLYLERLQHGGFFEAKVTVFFFIIKLPRVFNKKNVSSQF
jgi:hypothetical protein